MWSPDTTGFRRRACYHPACMNIPIPHSAFSDTTSMGSWGAFLACQGWKSRCFAQPAVSVEMGPQLFCGVWFEHSSYCPKGFCLAGLFLSRSFDWKKQTFWGTFFVKCTLVFSGCQLLQYPVWDIRGKKNIQETRSLNRLPSSLCQSEYSSVCFMYNF